MAIDMNVQELLVIGDSDMLIYLVQEESETKNSKILPCMHHIQELRKRFTKTEFQHVPRVQNEFANALATLSSMIQHPNTNFIDPIQEYLTTGEYPELANATQKRTLHRLSNNFFRSGGILYMRTPDLGLLSLQASDEWSCGGSQQEYQEDTNEDGRKEQTMA
ncbi:uncharacterized protein [Nicotiana sylvestris]|uniref:uncharacterized protein n=1 Tax=Nicotiana sylvestris TaxID=4096 RepID=UPI00388C6A96